MFESHARRSGTTLIYGKIATASSHTWGASIARDVPSCCVLSRHREPFAEMRVSLEKSFKKSGSAERQDSDIGRCRPIYRERSCDRKILRRKAGLVTSVGEGYGGKQTTTLCEQRQSRANTPPRTRRGPDPSFMSQRGAVVLRGTSEP